jgi:hypothetical protein
MIKLKAQNKTQICRGLDSQLSAKLDEQIDSCLVRQIRWHLGSFLEPRAAFLVISNTIAHQAERVLK